MNLHYFLIAPCVSTVRVLLLQPDRMFWLNTEPPIRLFGRIHPGTARANILVAAFIGRFYRRH